MNNMLLPSRVINVLAALKAQGFTMEFSQMTNGDIIINVYEDSKFKHQTFLRSELEFDLLDTQFEILSRLADAELQKKSAAVLEYLEGFKEA
jgi:hypothetical protein